jgi:hypothetical protein
MVLARTDMRSKEGRLLKSMRQALIKHLGGETRLTPPKRVLVERASMLQLRLSALDRRIIEGGFTEFDAKEYLAWSNSLTRTLVALGLEPTTAAATPDPMTRLAEQVRREREHAA